IGKAWREENSFESCLPDPATRLDAYLSRQESKWNIPKTVASAFNMKSKWLSAHLIKDDENRRLAVLVVESLKGNRLNKQSIDEIMVVSGRLVAHLITTLRSFEPDPAGAGEKGF
ncbi:MAG TPA: hypothetical protein VGJ82_23170, partial [Thermoanaerobaculia bacterium]